MIREHQKNLKLVSRTAVSAFLRLIHGGADHAARRSKKDTKPIAYIDNWFFEHELRRR